MSSKALSGKLATLCVILSMVATGCVKERVVTTTTTTPGTTGATTAPTTSSLATPVNPAAPPPYGEVEVDGVEMRQGRYPQGEYGGSLVQSQIASDPKTFNVWASNDSTSSKLAGLMWSGLLTTDAFTGDVITDMAKSYEVKPDHLTYIFHLRKGLKWSDGQPITADDVAYTFNTIVAKGFGNASLRDTVSVAGKTPTVTVVDPLTVQFVTAKPFAPFLRSAGTIPIAPKHICEPITSGKDATQKFNQLWSPTGIDTKTLVTSGPFVLDRFTPSQRVEFVRTKNYYVVDTAKKQLPYLDRLVFVFVPDVNTNLLKFKAGELDITQVRNRDAVDLQRDAQRQNFTLYNLGQNAGTTFLMFNLIQRTNKGKSYIEPYKTKWFNDANFRQAINHVINRQAIIDGYLKGIGVQTFTGQPAGTPFFNASLKSFDADAKVAMDLLTKSGFIKKGDALYDKDGHRVEFDMAYGAGGTFMPAVANYIQTDLKKLGIKANPQEIEGNSLINKVLSSRDWEACLFGLTNDPMEPAGGANVYKADGRMHLFDLRDQDKKVTDERDWEKQIDNLLDQGSEEFDTAKRKQIYNQIDQILYDQAPFIYLCSNMDIVAARNTIKNYVPTQLPASQLTYGLHNLDEIWKGK